MSINIEKISFKNLKMIQEIIDDEKLQEKVRLELDKREKDAKVMSINEYRSDRLPDFKDEYQKICEDLLTDFDLYELEFLWRGGFFGTKNNNLGDFYPVTFNFHSERKDNNLNRLVKLFREPKMQEGYEGTYNAINYVVNGLHKNIGLYDGKVTDKLSLFKDLPVRKLIVKEKFLDIVEYLWDLREETVNARLCVSNHGLTKNLHKKAKAITPSQRMLMEAVAFGCTLPELEQGNYEGAKRLIYVPREKLIK